jgi:SdpC family antimicrobial peptide
MKKSVPLWLVFALCVFSFGSAASANRAESAHQEYSGQEIFKGIVFGVGELGGKLPVDSRIAQGVNKNQEALKVVDNIVNEIDRLDPEYFKELQDAAYSKNLTKVDKAVERGGNLLKKALDNLDYTATTKQEVDMAAAAAGWIAMVGAAVYNYAGAVHTALAGINAAAYLNLAVYQYTWFWGSSASSSKMEREAYIVEVMEALDD